MQRYLEFVWFRALAEIRADSARGFFGFAWWIIEPILYMLMFYVVFGVIFQQRGDNYVSFLLCGLVPWKWFASSVQNASMSITRNMHLIYQVYLPKALFPAVAVLGSTLRFAIVFVILLLFLWANGMHATPAWLTDLPLLLLLQITLMLGLGMVLAAVVPFIPDLKLIIDNGLLLLFFLSGIFFRFDAIPESLRFYFDMNPVAVLIHGFREVLMAGHRLDIRSILPVVFVAAAFVSLGLVLLRRWDRLYAKRAFL